MNYLETRFVLPFIAILMGAILVWPLDKLTGAAWAAMAGTLVSGYLGLAGWTNKVEWDASLKFEGLKRDENI